MTGVYNRLAKKLDEIATGFPSTENGIELKILRKLYTPEDAELALELNPTPKQVETIAKRLGKSVSEMKTIHGKMAKRGQIRGLECPNSTCICCFR